MNARIRRLWARLRAVALALRPVERWLPVVDPSPDPDLPSRDVFAMGTGVLIDDHATMTVTAAADPDARPLALGDGVRVGRFVTIFCGEHVEIGEGSVLGSHAVVTDCWRMSLGDSAERTELPAPPGGPVVIGAGVHVGAGAVVGPAVTIGDLAVVEAGAVVIDDVPAGAVARGNPAAVVRRSS